MDAPDPRRRRFLAGTAAAALALAHTLASGNARAALRSTRARYLGCRRVAAESYVLAGFDESRGLRFQIPLPGRGHGAAVRPGSTEGVVLARRPGTFALVFDGDTGTVRHRLDAAPGRHFYGHGAYSREGRLLFTSENDFASGRGVIGVRDACDDYRQVGELPSHGVGPHEIRLMPDGTTLAVANGGIRTHPASGRELLNVDTMRPNLALVSSADGSLISSAALAPVLHKLSIRHLDVAADGRIAVAMQYQGAASDRVPLLALYDRGVLEPLAAPAGLETRMHHYTGSVAFDVDGSLIGATSPRGNLAMVWDGASGVVVSHATLGDCCGIAATGRAREFLITAGSGAVARLAGATGAIEAAGIWAGGAWRSGAWDNHVLSTPGFEPD